MAANAPSVIASAAEPAPFQLDELRREYDRLADALSSAAGVANGSAENMLAQLQDLTDRILELEAQKPASRGWPWIRSPPLRHSSRRLRWHGPTTRMRRKRSRSIPTSA